MKIHCCGCNKPVAPRLTKGTEIYPHSKSLGALPFWICDTCGNYVGCHHKTDKPTTPLGCIPTPELRVARKEIHAILDPAIKTSSLSRNQFYKLLSEKLGWRYHTANIRSIEEAIKVVKVIRGIEEEKGGRKMR